MFIFTISCVAYTIHIKRLVFKHHIKSTRNTTFWPILCVVSGLLIFYGTHLSGTPSRNLPEPSIEFDGSLELRALALGRIPADPPSAGQFQALLSQPSQIREKLKQYKSSNDAQRGKSQAQQLHPSTTYVCTKIFSEVSKSVIFVQFL